MELPASRFLQGKVAILGSECARNMRTICVLDEFEAEQLRHGEQLNCRKHRHVTRQEARALVLGAKRVPWIHCDTWNGEARWARLPDGFESGKHIILICTARWVKVTQRTKRGGLGWATLQLRVESKRN